MSEAKQPDDTKPASVKLGGTTYSDVAYLNMAVPGTEATATPQLTGWILQIAGPSHPATIELSNRQAKRANRRNAEKERAQVNGKKWKGDEEREPEEIRLETVTDITARIIGWSPAPDFEDGNGPIAYSPEAAIRLFMDRSKGNYFAQLVDFLGSEKAFLKASAKP